ncbi:hypothetical protein AAFC00_002037 [Neodothiora populina]|uniref:SPO22-domain-containing protein n=1 Tax=Neodothiora populina TaxID=2781224 RepID=A0ABR3PGD3_9PEZI
MAPPLSAKTEKEQRVAAILGFASQLQKQLDNSIIGSSTEEHLGQHLSKTFPVPTSSSIEELETLGRSLWNASIPLRQQSFGTMAFLPKLRVFAFYLLDMAYQALHKRRHGSTDNLVRVLRVALKAGKLCIERNQLDLCGRLFERAASYVETQDREQKPKADPHDQAGRVTDGILEELVAEYYLLRGGLAWKNGRNDLVEYWLSKAIIRGDLGNSAELVEKKADLLYEIGQEALKNKQNSVAVQWLQRSRDSIDTLDAEALSPDFCELRFAVLSELIRALIASKDEESLARASDMLSMLQVEDTEFKMSTCLLQLDLFSTQIPVDTEAFLSVLCRIIQTAHMIESNFQTIMHLIHKLRKANEKDSSVDTTSADLACRAIDCLLPRIFETGNQEWLERVAVVKILVLTSVQPTSNFTDTLQNMFDEILQSTGRPFSPEATHAAQSLLWRKVDMTPLAQHDRSPELWCRLACHPLFAKAGNLNKAKLSRKMILHALTTGDAIAARAAYFQMPESGKAAAITNYIMYKVALRSNDADLAALSLDGVVKASTKDASFLYACASEAQQSGDRTQAIAVLQKVLDHHSTSTRINIYLPALLRSTMKLIIIEMEKEKMDKLTALSELCKTFEDAMSRASTFREVKPGIPNDRYEAELQWFASYSYNLAVTHLADIRLELVVRFMTVCSAFTELLHCESKQDSDKRLQYRLLLCHFVHASALVVLARSEDNVEHSLSFYLDVRRQVVAFQTSYRQGTKMSEFDVELRDDVIVKDFELLKYDLEALLKLRSWNDLDRVLELCLAQQHSTRWGTIADVVIHIHTHIVNEQLDPHYQAKIPLVMEKIINASWKQHNRDVRKLSRWIRCLFQMTLEINPKMALKCLENARAIAGQANTAEVVNGYPKDEVAWLATSAFNHSVDLFCAHEKDKSRTWAENALSLAMIAGNDRSLHAALQDKWLRMQACEI